jgi:hypothetical protein
VVAVSSCQECCWSITDFVYSKYFPSTETGEDQSKSDETKTEAQKGQAIPEDKMEDAKQTQGDDAMIDDIKSELEVEAEDQTKSEDVGQSKSEEKGSELADLPDVPTTEPGEHGLPEAKKLKTSDS